MERYHIKYISIHSMMRDLVKDRHGDWVRYKSVEKLIKENNNLKEENEQLKQQIEELKSQNKRRVRLRS